MTNRARYPRESVAGFRAKGSGTPVSVAPASLFSLGASSPRSRGVEGGGRLIRHGARAQSPPLDIMCLPATHIYALNVGVRYRNASSLDVRATT